MLNHRRKAERQSPIRTELVARVRREIELGTYETPEKLEIAFGRLLGELEFDPDDLPPSSLNDTSSGRW